MGIYAKSEWKSTLKYDCGCQILERVSGKSPSGMEIIATMIDYCPKHSASSDMYEVLKALVNELSKAVAMINKQGFGFPANLALIGEKARQILAKIDGR